MSAFVGEIPTRRIIALGEEGTAFISVSILISCLRSCELARKKCQEVIHFARSIKYLHHCRQKRCVSIRVPTTIEGTA